MKRWLEQYWLPLLFIVLVVFGTSVVFAQGVISVPAKTRSTLITGLCVGTTWAAYRTKEGNLWVGCAGATPPDGSVRLRAR